MKRLRADKLYQKHIALTFLIDATPFGLVGVGGFRVLRVTRSEQPWLEDIIPLGYAVNYICSRVCIPSNSRPRFKTLAVRSHKTSRVVRV